MTEEEARAWLDEQFSVSRETLGKLEKYIAMLFTAMDEQNLIAESTKPHVWARHIVDSAQLVPLANGADKEGPWVDLGSGAGLPAIVAAILTDRPLLMIESRRKRVEFLTAVVDALGLRHAAIHGGRVERAVSMDAAIISARAYAPLPRLFDSAIHLSTERTIWLLPKGRNAENELEAVRPTWQGVFHVERSLTDPDSAIIVARAVTPKGKKGLR